MFNCPVLFSIFEFVPSWYRKQSLLFPRTIRSSVVPPVLSPSISLPPLILKVALFCNDNPELLTASLEVPPVFNSIVFAAEKWTNVSVSPSCNKAPAVTTSLAVIDPLKSSAVPLVLVIVAPPTFTFPLNVETPETARVSVPVVPVTSMP